MEPQRPDGHPLRERDRPDFESPQDLIRVVDLFAGCGGLTLGIAQAALSAGMGIDVRLAVDFDAAATDVYGANFPKAAVACAPVETLLDGELDADPTETEARTAERVGRVHVLVGGPPCQGHSSLNNHTRRDDPKNALYGRMARAAQVLAPSVVLCENVPAVTRDQGRVVETTEASLVASGYEVASATVLLQRLGVAQTRKRHVLLASKIPEIEPAGVLAELKARKIDEDLDLWWAIGDLADLQGPTGYDKPPVPSAQNLARMQYLLAKKIYDLPNHKRPACQQDQHSYKSMYGRLARDKPAQTITSGFGSIGQGRYMHPDQPRALTAHEAARIQGFPDYFDFSNVTRRAALATMIGNAVPPPLGREIGASIIKYLI